MTARKHREPVGARGDARAPHGARRGVPAGPQLVGGPSGSFPVLAEAWMHLASAAPWPDARRRRRGCRSNANGGGPPCATATSMPAPCEVGGCAQPQDRPAAIQRRPERSGLDRQAPDLRAVGAETFLSVGGWIEAFKRGDVEYLFTAFSELAAAGPAGWAHPPTSARCRHRGRVAKGGPPTVRVDRQPSLLRLGVGQGRGRGEVASTPRRARGRTARPPTS